MRTLDLYSLLRQSLGQSHTGFALFDTRPELAFLRETARSWGLDQDAIREWLESPAAVAQRETAETFLRLVPGVVAKVEAAFARELPGILVFMPSFGDFDGFARYELGEHRVLLGIDFPGADADYLRALTAHELSHVFRDHSPAVWGHLGKPLSQISRKEYLDAGTAQEHLVSEGLATLFSQALFPEIEARLHHYYEAEEWEWVLSNEALIDRALEDCLSGDEDVWSFYSPARVGAGSPSRTQYYWAAKRLANLLAPAGSPLDLRQIIDLHGRPADTFEIFRRTRS